MAKQRRGGNPHCGDAGYLAAARSGPHGAWVVAYRAAAQGLDVGGAPYGVVCGLHGTVQPAASQRIARLDLADPLPWCPPCRREVAVQRANQLGLLDNRIGAARRELPPAAEVRALDAELGERLAAAAAALELVASRLRVVRAEAQPARAADAEERRHDVKTTAT